MVMGRAALHPGFEQLLATRSIVSSGRACFSLPGFGACLLGLPGLYTQHPCSCRCWRKAPSPRSFAPSSHCNACTRRLAAGPHFELSLRYPGVSDVHHSTGDRNHRRRFGLRSSRSLHRSVYLRDRKLRDQVAERTLPAGRRVREPPPVHRPLGRLPCGDLRWYWTGCGGCAGRNGN